MTGEPVVTVYVPSLEVGGAQRVSVTIANGLAARGYAVDLLLSYRHGELLDHVSDRVRIVDLDTPAVPVAGIWASIPAFRSYLRSRRPDVLISAMTFANVVAIVAGRLSGANPRVVATEHTMFGEVGGYKEWVSNRLAATLYATVDRVVAVSRGVGTQILEETNVRADRLSVVYNPIDLGEIDEKAREPIDHPWIGSPEHEVVLMVGRPEPPKDLETLVRAFRRVREREPNARLIIAGEASTPDRSVREETLALAEQLGIGDSVSMPGYVNPYPYMREASVFVLSSEREGLPTVLMEALACGTTVVSTDCPSGPREILADGAFGTLVPVGDETALAAAIRSALRSPGDPKRLRDRARDFSVDSVIDEYVQIVEGTGGYGAA